MEAEIEKKYKERQDKLRAGIHSLKAKLDKFKQEELSKPGVTKVTIKKSDPIYPDYNDYQVKSAELKTLPQKKEEELKALREQYKSQNQQISMSSRIGSKSLSPRKQQMMRL